MTTLPEPSNVEIEQICIGSILRDNAQALRLSFLLPEHFAEPLHQRIYEAALRLILAGQTASPATLKSSFVSDEPMQSVGGVKYLANLVTMVGFSPDALTAGQHVFTLACKRNLIAASAQIVDHVRAAPDDTSPRALADAVSNILADATAPAAISAQDRFTRVAQFVDLAVEQATGPEEPPSVKFGIPTLDQLTGGMRDQELIICGARPGMGKTAFASHVAMEAASQGKSVAFFSMEMSGAAIGLRMVTAAAWRTQNNIAYQAARRRDLSPPQETALFEAQAWFRDLPLFIHEGRAMTPSAIALAARRMASITPVGLIVIDHLQKVAPERNRDNRTAEMTEITHSLQGLAGSLKCPILALSQLSRKTETREDRRPELGDLRESGSIEQDADIVLLLFREAYYLQKEEPPRSDHEAHTDWYNKLERCRTRLEIQVAKQRNGEEGTAMAFFDAPSSTIR